MPENLEDIFKPDVKTIKQIFGDADSYYYVPDYQRPFSWESEQIERLWDDVISAIGDSEKNYFLGPVILIKTEDGYEIIDGQQRLTTLTILFCVLRDIYYAENRTITNSIQSLVDNKYRLRLITQIHYQND